MRVYIVLHEDLFARKDMDDAVTTIAGVFTTIEQARAVAQSESMSLGLLPCDNKCDTWYDNDQGAQLIWITSEEVETK